MDKGEIASMRKLGVTESYKLKKQVVVSASEAAEMILRCVTVPDPDSCFLFLRLTNSFDQQCGQHLAIDAPTTGRLRGRRQMHAMKDHNHPQKLPREALFLSRLFPVTTLMTTDECALAHVTFACFSCRLYTKDTSFVSCPLAERLVDIHAT